MSVTDDLSFFQRVATRGSLTAVARELGLSLPAVSKRLTQLEQRLGVQLIQRTTRRLDLTPEGELYLEGARPILQQIEELESAVSNQRQSLRGQLRINATFGFGRRHLAPVLSRFAQLHPQIELSLELTSQPLSLLDPGVDICIRMGEPPDSRLVGQRLLGNPRILCAAPAYLERAGTPKTISDLSTHNCIVLRQDGSDYAIWRFRQNGQEQAQKVSGTLSSNDGEVAVHLALEGHGLILRSWWDVREHLANGRLIPLLQDYEAPRADIYAVYPHRRHVPQRIKVFIQFLAHALTIRLPDAPEPERT
ncbi:DNA-binding transcriptional LysR family regulator [Pseudomonas duriflava]|uniref:DNA-binding transcriptional LysR family regulator n=1 Tax=Pseudomonas duriflava TaxID=459528 RepID=A0A562QII9_9PSED|nr:LysR substrate-binding domain-containing protein [Pseudomonas duriflava]TWI56551.1 DNA-binding transcriptional LysR family regulator [Pseudomonas duriflava]